MPAVPVEPAAGTSSPQPEALGQLRNSAAASLPATRGGGDGEDGGRAAPVPAAPLLANATAPSGPVPAAQRPGASAAGAAPAATRIGAATPSSDATTPPAGLAAQPRGDRPDDASRRPEGWLASAVSAGSQAPAQDATRPVGPAAASTQDVGGAAEPDALSAPSSTTPVPARSFQASAAPATEPASTILAFAPPVAAAAPRPAAATDAPSDRAASVADLPLAQLSPAAPAATPAPAPATGAAPAAAENSGPPTPAVQITPALMALASAGASQSITLKLDPGELGRLDIRIDRSTDGPVAVRLTAEKPQTLALLTRDQAALERTLDQAGIPAQGRTVSYHIAGPEGLATDILRAAQPTSHAAAQTAQTALGSSQTPIGGAAGETARHGAGDPGLPSANGGQGGDSGGSGGQRQRGEGRSAAPQGPDDVASISAPWRSVSTISGPATSGIDITA